MASKQSVKLFDLSRKLTNWSFRFHKFFKHQVLFQRKKALLVGGNPSLRKILTQKLSTTWQVTQVIHQSKIAEQQQTTRQQKNIKYTTEVMMQQLLSSSKNMGYFDAIIMIPGMNETIIDYDVKKEQFVTQGVQMIKNNTLKCMQVYRLANKYLSNTGVVILSSSQRDYLKNHDKINNSIQDKNSSEKQNDSAIRAIIDAQVAYLGVIVGERDYTDLNSWSLVALSQQMAMEDPELVCEMYRNWADGYSLPMPGSFAIWKKDKGRPYVTYL